MVSKTELKAGTDAVKNDIVSKLQDKVSKTELMTVTDSIKNDIIAKLGQNLK